ncbi:MAG TPA: alanine--tRNA ligase, partial [Spirochaetes bacterium]|nr:alanine--tRNA ligase [Spirochaetota bacterium]
NQYNQQLGGELLPLPKTGIDTGLGLERLTMISQGVQSVYETDMFKATIDQILSLSGISYDENSATPIHVISDHLRGVCFLLAENILPSNEGRGYVIRRILRRAIRFSRFIGLNKPFISKLVPTIVDVMGSTYPELVKQSEKMQKIIASEEETFFTTLAEGSIYLENLVSGYMDQGKKVISGKEAFKLYDSMGFPIDLTSEIASEKGLSVDIKAFDQLMDQQKKRGRATVKNDGDDLPFLDKQTDKTVYCGEEQNECESKIVSLLKKDSGKIHEIDHCSEGDEVIVITEKTPFYGNSGGQVGDQGILKKQKAQMQVTDTQIVKGIILHYATVQKGTFKNNDKITLAVDETMRMSTARNHSATHLLQFVLQNILGDHVRQLGSLVSDEKLRFDFSHFHAMTNDEIITVEKAVNDLIRQNTRTQIEVMDKNEALKQGAMAFFGDKYDQSVRTVQIGESFELCGGSHIRRSGDIGCFKIISESSIASGTRRIEAVTGEKAIELYSDLFNLSKQLEHSFNAPFSSIEERVTSLIDKNKQLEKEIKQLKTQSVVSNIGDMIKEGLSRFGDAHYVGLALKDKDINELRNINDKIKSKYQKLVTVLLSEKEDKIFYISSVSKDLAQNTIQANDIIKQLSDWLGGKGGGKEQMAQGTSPATHKNIPEILDQLKTYIQSFFKSS